MRLKAPLIKGELRGVFISMCKCGWTPLLPKASRGKSLRQPAEDFWFHFY